MLGIDGNVGVGDTLSRNCINWIVPRKGLTLFFPGIPFVCLPARYGSRFPRGSPRSLAARRFTDSDTHRKFAYVVRGSCDVTRVHADLRATRTDSLGNVIAKMMRNQCLYYRSFGDFQRSVLADIST